MTVQGVSLGEMFKQSTAVLTRPSPDTFEQFEQHGGQREGLIYVVVAAAIAGVVAAVFSILSGFGAALMALLTAMIGPIVGYFIFAFLIHYVGTRQGGTGTQDEVFYSMALFTAPILAFNGIIGSIPLLNCLALPVVLALSLYQLYLGYVATRSSMNLDSNKALITVIIAIVVEVIVFMVIGLVMGILAASFGVVANTISG